jgi:hypothetical protein
VRTETATPAEKSKKRLKFRQKWKALNTKGASAGQEQFHRAAGETPRTAFIPEKIRGFMGRFFGCSREMACDVGMCQRSISEAGAPE